MLYIAFLPLAIPRCIKGVWTWHLGTLFCGRIGSARLMGILDNLKGLLNLNDSVILLFFFLLSEQHIKQFSSNSVSF